jgi:uncharacterized protein YdaU (DUF1376 family)
MENQENKTLQNTTPSGLVPHQPPGCFHGTCAQSEGVSFFEGYVMAKDPAFLFYSSDFLTGTMFFSNEQVGIYVRLLCAQHQHGGYVEKDFFEQITEGHDVIKKKFILTEYGYFNERLKEETEKRKKYTESRRNNLTLKAKKHHMESHMDCHMAPHMENENENENVIINENENINEIEIKLKPEKTAYREYVKMLPEEHQKLVEKYGPDKTEQMLDTLDAYKGSKGKKYRDDYRAVLSWVAEKVLSRRDPNSAIIY